MISKFFIDRPVFASVLSIITVITGIICAMALPISQYPDIIPPQVVINATYPGASSEVIASTVAAPIEQQINGVPKMLYMRSTNSNSGTMSLVITFEIGTDPDQATIEVNNRLQSVLPRLPEEVRRQGITVNKSSSSFLQVVTMFSPDGKYDPVYISNYALLNVIDELKKLNGIGEVTLFGAKDYSMRIWLNTPKLVQYNLTSSDIINAIREQNSQFAVGTFGKQPMDNPQSFSYIVNTNGRFTDPKEFEEIIIFSDQNGNTLRIKDVARVELGSQDYDFSAKFNGKPSVGIGIFLQPGGNALSATRAVSDKMEELSKRFPKGISYSVPFNTTKFVKLSIEEVIRTFAEAILLVIFVVYLFLQNARATLIPLVAVPVSLIGTFIGMYFLGFSINLLTLFGMVLAIGIVVDDAIVVLENVERIMRTENLPPREASIKAMKEVTGPIITIILVLAVVFIPVGFMGGLTGEMYKQFAITIAISVTISGIVALTLSPALCALILKPHNHQQGKFFRLFNDYFDKLTGKYLTIVKILLNKSILGIIIFIFLIAITVSLFNRIPNSLVPEEDQGYALVMPVLLPASSLNRTEKVTDEITNRLMKIPAVKNVVSFAGFDLLSFSQKSSSGALFVIFKDWQERKKYGSDSKSLAMQIMQLGADIKDAMIFAFTPPPITGMSMTGGFEGYIQSRKGGDQKDLAAKANELIAAASKRKELMRLQTTISANLPQYYVDLDRIKTKSLKIPIHDVFATMQSTFGTFYVNDFNIYGRIFRVSISSEAKYREKPEDIRHIFVRSITGKMIPLSSLIKVKRIIGSDVVDRYNVFPSAKIMGEPAPGFSSGQAIIAMEEIANQILGADYTLEWTGSAFQEKISGNSGVIAFIFSIIMVFLILAAQYERWSIPLAIIATVPFGVFGAALAVWIRGLNNDIYFQIGLLTLIGLCAKNAILIVEFAITKYKEGKSIIESASEAALLRFRPIVMTSLAFILGCVPLAISTGAGANSRHSIGTGVIGGMLAATFIATFFIPMFYKLIMQISERRKNTNEVKNA